MYHVDYINSTSDPMLTIDNNNSTGNPMSCDSKLH